MTDTALPPSKYRLRLTFAKKAAVKYIAHLDLVLAWERALRRAGIPLAYSQGFNPQAKIQVASGLPVGTMGAAEILDIIVTESIDLEAAFGRINRALPDGLELGGLEEVPLKSPALQDRLRQAEYRVLVESLLPPEELTDRIEALLAADRLIQIRQRKNRPESFDLRPWLHELRLEDWEDGQIGLFMRLTAGQHGNLRPEAVLEALGLGQAWAEIERTRLTFEEGSPAAPGEEGEESTG